MSPLPATMYILNQFIGDADKVLFSPDRDNCTEPYITMKEALAQMGYRCETVKDQPIDEVAWVLFWDMDSVVPRNYLAKLKYYLRMKRAGGNSRDMLAEARRTGGKVKTALLMFEPPSVSPRNWDLSEHKNFDLVFTWDPSLVDGKKYLQIYLPSPVEFHTPPRPAFSQRKLLVDITSNKQTRYANSLSNFRRDTIVYFSTHHPAEFDLYGFGWNPPFRRWLFMQLKGSKTYLGKIANYRGTASSKAEIYSKYRFSICFENMQGQHGYVSLKILDAIRSGCVPIYLGSPDIDKYIPPEAYVDRRRFVSHADLYTYLSRMPESTYQKFIDAGVQMFESGAASKFLSPHFSESIVSRLHLPVLR